MIRSIYKGIEIEMEMHQQAHGYWKCDDTLGRKLFIPVVNRHGSFGNGSCQGIRLS
jgi:hypothetical protein